VSSVLSSHKTFVVTICADTMVLSLRSTRLHLRRAEGMITHMSRRTCSRPQPIVVFQKAHELRRIAHQAALTILQRGRLRRLRGYKCGLHVTFMTIFEATLYLYCRGWNQTFPCYEDRYPGKCKFVGGRPYNQLDLPARFEVHWSFWAHEFIRLLILNLYSILDLALGSALGVNHLA
jgi:hypothetical protein